MAHGRPVAVIAQGRAFDLRTEWWRGAGAP
jgi:hypothetical protein